MHRVSKQGATLHGRGKHGEAAQARCHGQRKSTRPVMNLGSRVFYFPMAPSQEGERAERLTNTLFGAKHGGRHHR